MRGQVRRIFEENEAPDALRQLVDLLRPAGNRSGEEQVREFVEALEEDDRARAGFGRALRTVIGQTRLVHALAESGILADVGFLSELQRRIARRLLPAPRAPNDLRSVLPSIFGDSNDWQWVKDVSHQTWAELVMLVVVEDDLYGHPHEDIDSVIQGLAQRIGALGIDEELVSKLPHAEDYESPFLDLSFEAHQFIEDHRPGMGREESFEALTSTVRECRDMIVYLRKNKPTFGTSLRLTAISRRLLQQLDRLDLLTHLVRPESPRDLVDCSVRLFRSLLEAIQTANSLRRLSKESADLLAFQITEESARKGQKYITDSRRGYWEFLRAAMQGGVIVAVFALFKVYLGSLPLSLAGEAIAYSVNYAVCFVLIYLTGSILATKQPAVTASAIARKMDQAATEHGALEGVADIIVLVWRSQFVSFVGNLVCAFPIGWALVYGLTHWLEAPPVDAYKAASLLDSVHPWASGALFYAAIAGVFLFLAGVITGAVANHVLYVDFRQRLAEHPRLAFLRDRGKKLAHLVTDNIAMLSGNVVLGIFLGVAGPLGVIFGLPFDIRHIAFSSANVGFAMSAAPELVTLGVAGVAILGVIGIGFVNFLVSFLLTMFIGLESRQVTFGQSRELLVILLKRLVRRPWEWFWPARAPKYSLPKSTSDADLS
jgi:site-specific recombinase